MCSDRLVICGPGATKLVNQLRGQHRAWSPTGMSMPLLLQVHENLRIARRRLQKLAKKSLTATFGEAPALEQELQALILDDKVFHLSASQFHFCELNKQLRSIFSKKDAETEDASEEQEDNHCSDTESEGAAPDKKRRK